MKQLSILNQNIFALVDDEDYHRLVGYVWCKIGSDKRFTIARNTLQVTNFGLKPLRIVLANHIMGDTTVIFDHKDRNQLNNQKSNLRPSSQSQNSCNRDKIWKGTSIYKGVSWSKMNSKWESRITYNRKTIRIGFFDNEIEAAWAYNIKCKELHGEFGVLNKIVQDAIDSTKNVKEDESTMIEEEGDDEE